MSRNISDLHPTLQRMVRELRVQCALVGLNIGIGECYRTVEEQEALYAQGRTTAGNIVTNARGKDYNSMHQWRVAFDFYRNDGKGAYNNSDKFFNKVGAIGKSIGLEWGGDWTSPVDLPHFQLPYWGSTPTKLKKLFLTPEKFKESWEDEEMTKEEIQKMIDDSIRNNKEKIYNWTLECPEWTIPTVQKLLDKGYLVGNDKGELGLTENMLKVFVINDRAGLYD